MFSAIIAQTPRSISDQRLQALIRPPISTTWTTGDHPRPSERHQRAPVYLPCSLSPSFVLDFVFNFFQKWIMVYTGHMIMHDLRMNLFRHIQSLSMEFFTRNPVGRLVTRVTNDVQNMDELFTSVIAFIFKDLFLLLGIASGSDSPQLETGSGKFHRDSARGAGHRYLLCQGPGHIQTVADQDRGDQHPLFRNHRWHEGHPTLSQRSGQLSYV